MPSLRVLNELQIKQNGITTIYKVGTVNGYYKTTDGKFYEEPSYITEIEGQPNLIYADIAGDNLYIYETSTSSFRKVSKGGDSEDNIKFGYYKETDGKFYKDNQYQVEIPGNVNYIFIGLDNNTIYRYDTIENDFIDIGGEVTDYSSEINSLAIINSQQTSEIGSLATINSQQTSEISSLATINSQQTNEINSLTAVDSQQTNEINSLTAVDSQQTTRINSVATSMSELATIANSLTTENSLQTSQLESLNTTTSELTSTFLSQSTAQSEIDSTQNRSINSLSAENSSQTSKIVSLSSSSSELARAVTSLSSEVSTKQDRLTAGTGISIENNVISATGGGQGGDVTSEIESLSASLSEIASIVSSESTTQSEIDSLQNSYINSLTSENVVRRFEISSLFTDTSELGSEVDIINSEVAVINSELAEKQDILTAGPGITISGTTISSTPRLEYAIVDVLPVTDISTTTLYLVPKTDTDTDDFYDEWAYINNAWEHIGNTKIDLTDYYNKTYIDSAFTSQSTEDSLQARQISSLSVSASELASFVSSESVAQSQLDSTQNRTLSSLSVASSELGSEVTVLNSEVAEKQDTLTAGSGINIDENNTIKAVARMLFPSGN